MIIGFDLDGTLDQPALCDLAYYLDQAGHTVHVITGTFPDTPWQTIEEKYAKISRLGLDVLLNKGQMHVLDALPVTPLHDLQYVLRDLGMRKGDLCSKLGIELFFEDSDLFCEMIKKLSGTTTALCR